MYRILTVAAAAVGLAACGGDGSDTRSGSAKGDRAGATASLALNVSASPDFHGNSVKICGERKRNSDSKYVCEDKLYPCECFDFDSDGTLKSTNGSYEPKIDNLCPSSNVPVADWEFEYKIFKGPGCTGEVLNEPYNPHNFVCYDIDDLGKRHHPNKSIEHLAPGKNENQVICVTKDAEKKFDFDVCVDETTWEDHKYGAARLDCGCEPVVYPAGTVPNGPACECPQSIEELPVGCEFDEYTCDIVCSGKKNGTPE